MRDGGGWFRTASGPSSRRVGESARGRLDGVDVAAREPTQLARVAAMASSRDHGDAVDAATREYAHLVRVDAPRDAVGAPHDDIQRRSPRCRPSRSSFLMLLTWVELLHYDNIEMLLS